MYSTRLRQLFYFSAVYLLTIRVAFAQTNIAKEASNPVEGANKVTVRTGDSTQQSIAKMQRILSTQGYAVDTVRSTYITTKPRALNPDHKGFKVPLFYIFTISITELPSENQLVINGNFIDDSNPKYHFVIPMRWIGPGDTSPDQACFNQAAKIAKSYVNGKVSYGKIKH